MEHYIAALLAKKGIIYGFLIGIMKVMKDARDGKLKLVTVITDLAGSILIGYVAYEVVSLTSISELTKIIWTIFMASNAFLVIAVMSDKQLFNKIVDKYIKKI